MCVSKAVLLVIDIEVQESFQHRRYGSNDDLPGVLEWLEDLVDRARNRDIPDVQSFHVTNPSSIYRIQNPEARSSKRKNRRRSETNMTCV